MKKPMPITFYTHSIVNNRERRTAKTSDSSITEVARAKSESEGIATEEEQAATHDGARTTGREARLESGRHKTGDKEESTNDKAGTRFVKAVEEPEAEILNTKM
jgi:hypothetical protein